LKPFDLVRFYRNWWTMLSLFLKDENISTKWCFALCL